MTDRPDPADIDRLLARVEEGGQAWSLGNVGTRALAAEVVALRVELDCAADARDSWMRSYELCRKDLHRERAAREAAERERDRRRDEQEELSRLTWAAEADRDHQRERANANWSTAQRIEADRDRLARRVAELEAALRVIAADDELVEVNDAAFSIHAFRRVQQTARAALAGDGGGA